ncbi:MAG TPA: MFS transporter [Tepidisphaeraceae bacterium]|jgi:putative MFS transporter
MAQTYEGFVGNALDDAKISPLHIKVIALIAAGYFFDVIDLIVLGSLIPDMIGTKFATPAEAAWIGSATVFGMFIGGVAQGEFSDRFGRKAVYQFNLLIFGVFTILGALAPTVWMLVGARFIAGLGLGGEQPLAFAYAGEYSPKRIRGRILAFVHFIGGACVWPIATLFTLAFRDEIGWRGVWIVIGVGALIVWIFRFTLPESPRWLATHGKGKQALDVLARMNVAGPTEPLSTDAASDTKSDPFVTVFTMFPVRVIAAMICFSAFFGVAIGLGGWLPNIMHDKGFTITKSLEFTLGMNLAVPVASLFMMYALDRYGRKVTSISAFVGAGIMAIVFANAGSNTQLLIIGFIMVFFIQVAGNSMQIFASEVFPTNARASGFGWAAGVGRLSTAGIFIAIPWVQKGWGLTAVFACIATLLIVAAVAVTLMGPESRQRGLDEIAPPTG